VHLKATVCRAWAGDGEAALRTAATRRRNREVGADRDIRCHGERAPAGLLDEARAKLALLFGIA